MKRVDKCMSERWSRIFGTAWEKLSKADRDIGAFIIDNCLWNFYDYKMTKEFTVPASVTRIKGGYTHNSHEFEWFGFSLNDTIEKVIFEKGSKIEVIEEDAFSECASLKAVVIPSDVEIDLSVFPEGITIERY